MIPSALAGWLARYRAYRVGRLLARFPSYRARIIRTFTLAGEQVAR